MLLELFKRYHHFLCEGYPELILGEEPPLKTIIEEKIITIAPMIPRLRKEGHQDPAILELCFQSMKASTAPSRFLFLKGILQEHFHGDYLFLREQGTLSAELIRLLGQSETLFGQYPISEGEIFSAELRQALIPLIADFLKPSP